jgi:hypothetical protein
LQVSPICRVPHSAQVGRRPTTANFSPAMPVSGIARVAHANRPVKTVKGNVGSRRKPGLDSACCGLPDRATPLTKRLTHWNVGSRSCGLDKGAKHSLRSERSLVRLGESPNPDQQLLAGKRNHHWHTTLPNAHVNVGSIISATRTCKTSIKS